MFETLSAAHDLLSSSFGRWVDVFEMLGTFASALGYFYFRFRRKQNERVEEIADIIEETRAANGRRVHLVAQRERAESALAASLAKRAAAAQQIPQFAVEEAWRHHKASDTEQAAATLLGWWEATHAPSAEVHGQLAEWYAMFAEADDDGPDATANAEAARKLALRHFLIAENLAPEDWSGRAAELALTGDPSLEADDDLERHFSLPVGLNRETATLLVNRLIERSRRQLELGHYWVSYALAARGSLIASRVLPRSELLLSVEYRRADALRFAGHSRRALPIAQETWAARKDKLGADHPSTLASGYLVASILRNLGRNDDALPIAKDTWEAKKDKLGADHPSTLASGYLVAQILSDLGRNDEALPIAHSIWESEKAHPDRGASHPHTLTSRRLVASILKNLGHHAEALPLAEGAHEALLAHESVGPRHQRTLNAALTRAQILTKLERPDEARAIATGALAIATEALAETHPVRRKLTEFVASLDAAPAGTQPGPDPLPRAGNATVAA